MNKMEIVTGRPLDADLERENANLVEHMNSMRRIDSEPTFDRAVEAGKAAGALIDSIIAWFKPMKDAAHKAHKTVCDQEKAELAGLRDGRDALRERVAAYLQKEKERESARLLLIEEARRKEEEIHRRAVEAAAKRNAPPPPPPAPLPAAPLPKSKVDGKGVSVTTKYRGVVTDKTAFIRAIANGDFSDAYLVVDQRRLDQAAAQLASSGVTIPGVRWESYTESKMARR